MPTDCPLEAPSQALLHVLSAEAAFLLMFEWCCMIVISNTALCPSSLLDAHNHVSCCLSHVDLYPPPLDDLMQCVWPKACMVLGCCLVSLKAPGVIIASHRLFVDRVLCMQLTVEVVKLATQQVNVQSPSHPIAAVVVQVRLSWQLCLTLYKHV